MRLPILNCGPRVNRSFGAAVEAWNRRDYATAQGLFREHLAHYPQSPWASEALLHLAYAALAHSGYGEAQRYFQTVVTHNEPSSSPGAQKVLSKARIYLALLKARQGDSSQANKLLSMVMLGSPDWRDRTYASHWLQTLSRQRSGVRDRIKPTAIP